MCRTPCAFCVTSYLTPRACFQVQNVPQLKYVEDEDLVDLGMTKPEMRRLKKFFRKECPQGKLSKLIKVRLHRASSPSSLR